MASRSASPGQPADRPSSSHPGAPFRMDAVRRQQIATLRSMLEHQLHESVLPFWVRHSPDPEHGGMFNCLNRDGSVYDTRKNVWLLGRQVWMLSRLQLDGAGRPEWMDLAASGMRFLREHAIEPDGRCWFALTREGKPLWRQRKIFSECFHVMALAGYAHASGESAPLREAEELLERIWTWSEDLRLVGAPVYEGAPAAQSLAVPMILLNLIEEVVGPGDPSRFNPQVEACVDRMLLHVDSQRRVVRELVAPDGSPIDSIEGRLLNPGHAIEAGWFLQSWARRLGREELSRTAAQMVRWSMERGWDREYGGLFYFLDVEGYSPVQLEWDMKLWWPHNEAMVAFAHNLLAEGLEQDWLDFLKVTNYALERFPDPEHGEWFGYLNRRGEVTHNFKGGPYKGCFHVPRSLHLCCGLLDRIQAAFDTEAAP